MEYWVSSNGEKVGPLKEWDIRAMIEDGSVTKDDLVWHVDLPEWTRIDEYHAFKSNFEEPEVEPEIEESEDEAKADGTPEVKEPAIQVTNEHYFWRRGFAKLFDLFLYTNVFIIVLNSFGVRYGFDEKLSQLGVIQLVPFFFLEALLLQRFGITPGKWLLGLKVVPIIKESRLIYMQTFTRSAASWFFGMALGLIQLSLISVIVNYFITKSRGITTWALLSRTTLVEASPFNAAKAFRYVGMLFVICAGLMTYVSSDPEMQKTVEEFRKDLIKQYPQYEKILTPPAPQD